jgi:flavin reductase (DIM6/NTAB) family NADH-FMN oxidoreductase RutF
MRSHAAGVTIITTMSGGRRYGMTATAVTSLCMTPPALTICVNRDASIHPALLERGAFCVNLLKSGDAGFCRAFSAASSAERFEHGAWKSGEHGLPRLLGSQAAIACRIGPSLDFGSHTIIVGEVLGVSTAADVAPLVYLDGAHLAIAGTA